MIEIWKDAPGIEDRIEVSNLGNVRTKSRTIITDRQGTVYSRTYKGCTISKCVGNNGYYYIAVKTIDKRPKFTVHRLIAKAFVPGYEDGLTVNHINGNKMDNRAENLEWVTLAENTRLQWDTGLVNLRGENHPSSTLTENQVRDIKKAFSYGVSGSELARRYNVPRPTIYSIKYGHSWKHIK